MFKDNDEKDYYYYITKRICDEIHNQLDEINIEDYLNLDLTIITVNNLEHNVEIETTYIQDDNSYCKNSRINRFRPTIDFLPKIVYMWYKYFNHKFENQCIYFSKN